MSASIRSLLAQHHGKIRLLEVHDQRSKEIVRNVVGDDGESFHGVWISGLTQTTYLGVSDTELLSPLKRASLIDGLGKNPQQNHCRPLCAAYDADGGGNVVDVPALVALLASIGVSMIVIEDKSTCKPGEKVNSLTETSNSQAQASIHEFVETIRAFTSARAQKDMMIVARIESFTLRVVEPDEIREKASVQNALRKALTRAEAYRIAGADAIMIHSKSALSDEVLSFIVEYRSKDSATPLVVVPTTYSETTENALYHAGANVIIYANHLMRAKIQAISEVSNRFLSEKPRLFSQDAESSACVEVRNFGCLLQKLSVKDLSEEAEQYRVLADKHATENMTVVVKALLDGKRSGAADAHIIPVRELLRINAHPVSAVGELAEAPAREKDGQPGWDTVTGCTRVG